MSIQSRPTRDPLRIAGAQRLLTWRSEATAWQLADFLQGHRRGRSSDPPRTARRTRASPAALASPRRPRAGLAAPPTTAARSGSQSRRPPPDRTPRTCAPRRSESAPAFASVLMRRSRGVPGTTSSGTRRAHVRTDSPGRGRTSPAAAAASAARPGRARGRSRSGSRRGRGPPAGPGRRWASRRPRRTPTCSVRTPTRPWRPCVASRRRARPGRQRRLRGPRLGAGSSVA